METMQHTNQDASELHRRESVDAQALTVVEAGLYARFFSVLSDPTRVRLIHLLLNAPEPGLTVSQLVAAIGAPQSRVSTHLGCLRWCGFVQDERQGKYVYYRILDERVRAMLALGGSMMHDHAANVASCSVIE